METLKPFHFSGIIAFIGRRAILPITKNMGGVHRMAGYTCRSTTFRLHPGSRTKHTRLAQTAGACRWVWNQSLAHNQQQYASFKEGKAERPSVSFQSLGVWFTQLRKPTDWLQTLPYAPIRYMLKYQSDAWKKCFKEGGFPKFKARRGEDSFTIPQDIKVNNGSIPIPKIGWMKLSRKGGNPYEGCEPVNAVVKRDLGRWCCTVVYKALDTRTDNGLAVGVDRNVCPVAVSTGDILDMPDIRTLEARKKRYQRRMARRIKGSNRRAVARHRYAKTCQKIRTVRENWHHQVSRCLADAAGTVVIEDLKTTQLTQSAKGTMDKPGRNVKQKAGLNREILKTGWGGLKQKLDYKAFRMLEVHPAYTSQTCHECGAIDQANRKTQSEFKCVHCGHTDNADINAALNILASGIGASGRGGALERLSTPRSRQNVYEMPDGQPSI